jgi:hypothetical protein
VGWGPPPRTGRNSKSASLRRVVVGALVLCGDKRAGLLVPGAEGAGAKLGAGKRDWARVVIAGRAVVTPNLGRAPRYPAIATRTTNTHCSDSVYCATLSWDEILTDVAQSFLSATWYAPTSHSYCQYFLPVAVVARRLLRRSTCSESMHTPPSQCVGSLTQGVVIVMCATAEWVSSYILLVAAE